MTATESISDRFGRVEAAFRKDGFEPRPVPAAESGAATAKYVERNGRIGVLAEHRAARNTVTGTAKKAFYVEGDNETMGRLLGLLAEPEIARMTGEFLDNVALDFFDIETATKSGIVAGLKKLIIEIVADIVEPMKPDIPAEYHEEIAGIARGCREANPATTVTEEKLWLLNVGFDGLLAHIYTGEVFAGRGIHPRYLKTPLMCNAFAAPGEGAARWFGRDFMFPTADVFQDTACLIVYRPDDRNGRSRKAFASQTAPGFVGSMAAVNEEGTAIGIDMSPSWLCDPDRPGFNGLLLNRDCMERCASASEAVEHIVAARRGVSWLYPVADSSGAAYVVEAGRVVEGAFPYYESVPRYYRRRLPSLEYIGNMRLKYGTPEPRRGVVARDAAYRYPGEYLEDWNEGLWKAFDRNLFEKALDIFGDLVGILGDIVHLKFKNLGNRLRKDIEDLMKGADFSAADFSERGYINKTWKDRNCPGPFYFAPQRESRPDAVLVSNHCISPEMRLTAMGEWIAIIASANQNDIQWRYDELNRELLEALDASPGGLDRKTAWELIDFLRPDGRFPGYYNRDGSRDWRRLQVKGSVSLFELASRSMTSLFGYYGDDPVTISLKEYLH